MSESDLEFVERMHAMFLRCEAPAFDEGNRLHALARRGAATRWRPIIKYRPEGYAHGVFARYKDGRRVFRAGIPACDLEYYSHFIPLSALGEPE